MKTWFLLPGHWMSQVSTCVTKIYIPKCHIYNYNCSSCCYSVSLENPNFKKDDRIKRSMEWSMPTSSLQTTLHYVISALPNHVRHYNRSQLFRPYRLFVSFCLLFFIFIDFLLTCKHHSIIILLTWYSTHRRRSK